MDENHFPNFHSGTLFRSNGSCHQSSNNTCYHGTSCFIMNISFQIKQKNEKNRSLNNEQRTPSTLYISTLSAAL